MDKKEFINKQMDLISVPYELEEWKSKLQYPYTTGEFVEDPSDTEDGAEVSNLLLTCWNRGSKLALEEIRKKVKKHFNDLRGTTDGGAIAVFYEGAFPVPSGEDDLQKIQINLKIKEWKGDL